MIWLFKGPKTNTFSCFLKIFFDRQDARKPIKLLGLFQPIKFSLAKFDRLDTKFDRLEKTQQLYKLSFILPIEDNIEIEQFSKRKAEITVRLENRNLKLEFGDLVEALKSGKLHFGIDFTSKSSPKLRVGPVSFIFLTCFLLIFSLESGLEAPNGKTSVVIIKPFQFRIENIMEKETRYCFDSGFFGRHIQNLESVFPNLLRLFDSRNCSQGMQALYEIVDITRIQSSNMKQVQNVDLTIL